MLKRVLAGLVGVMTVANGLAMLVDGATWYARVPGVADTGPYNSHFVQDIGLAFIIAGAGLIVRGWRSRYWAAGAAGAAYLAAHAGLHLAGLGHSHHAAFDLALIVVPALLALWVAMPDTEKRHA